MTPTLRALAVLLAASSVALADGAAAQARVDAFQKEAAARRAALGLERGDPRLLAEYPPPALALAQGAEPQTACPGQEVAVKVVGRIAKGSLVVVLSDDVEVTGEKLTDANWEAKVKVKASALPGDVLLRVTTPVSAAWRATRVLDVGCRHRWVLDLAGGERLTVVTAWPKGANTAVQADGTWSKGGQALGTARLTVRAGETFTFERVESAEETAAAARLRASTDFKAVEARAAEAQARVNRCSSGPPAEQQPCLKTGGEALARVAAERDALRQKALAAVAPRFGCDVVKVKRDADALAGRAEGCRGERAAAAVTGTVAAEQ